MEGILGRIAVGRNVLVLPPFLFLVYKLYLPTICLVCHAHQIFSAEKAFGSPIPIMKPTPVKMRSNQHIMCKVYLDEKIILTLIITNTNLSAFLRKQNIAEIGQKKKFES